MEINRPKKGRKYIYVLDFEDGRVYRYDVWLDDSEEIETRERQHGDFTYTYGWAAGLKVRVTPVLFVEGRFSSLYGGPIDFVDRESIQIGEEGGITFDNVSSRTDMHIIEAGISFEF